MRDIVLDTYAGEGPFDPDAEDYPGWKHIYYKVCEGAYGYLEHSGYREVTIQIAEASKDFDSKGLYHYPRRNDYINWQTQADAYLRQCDILDSAGIEIDYDVQDVERRNIINDDGSYPRAHGYHLRLMWEYITTRTKRPFMIYSDPYSRRDCFYKYGYTWVDELPWICAQYPYRNSDPIEKVMEKWEQAVEGTLDPSLYPVTYKPVMWQVTDRYYAGDWFPQSQGADVNVWLTDWRKLLGKQNCIKRMWDRITGRRKMA